VVAFDDGLAGAEATSGLEGADDLAPPSLASFLVGGLDDLDVVVGAELDVAGAGAVAADAFGGLGFADADLVDWDFAAVFCAKGWMVPAIGECFLGRGMAELGELVSDAFANGGVHDGIYVFGG